MPALCPPPLLPCLSVLTPAFWFLEPSLGCFVKDQVPEWLVSAMSKYSIASVILSGAGRLYQQTLLHGIASLDGIFCK